MGTRGKGWGAGEGDGGSMVMERDLTWGSEQYNVQMMCCRIVHLKLINFINQCDLKNIK